VHYGQFPHPLAYIEWFQPLSRPDPQTGFYRLVRSTRNQKRFYAVVGVHELFAGCHLAPKFESMADASWTLANVLERCEEFYLNPYINSRLFDTIEQIQYRLIV
jgi:hypothetical protein